MIKLDISTLTFFYILFSVVLLAGLWMLFGHKGMRRPPARRPEDYIWRCSVCSHNYIDSKHEDISICPLCGSYNKKEEEVKR